MSEKDDTGYGEAKGEAKRDDKVDGKAKGEAKKGKGDGKAKKDKVDGKAKKAKGKKGKKGKNEVDASAGPSIAAHPRASHQVRRAKGWGGITGFGIAAYLSYKAGVPTVDLGLRGIIAGVAGYMLAWACAVTVWRHLMLAELRAATGRGSAPNPDLIPARANQSKATDAAGAPSGS